MHVLCGVPTATPDVALDVSDLRAKSRIKFQWRLENPPLATDATVPLTRVTCRKKFHSLLHLEELEHMKVLANKLVYQTTKYKCQAQFHPDHMIVVSIDFL